jgi:protein tyrosine/serine phosphatase
VKKNNINLVRLYLSHHVKITLGLNIAIKHDHLNENLIKEALEIILNVNNYPILICCE